MPQITLGGPADVEGWRAAARRLDLANAPPETVTWRLAGEAGDLFADEGQAPQTPQAEGEAAGRPAPRALVELFETMLLHSDPERFALAYRLLWRSRQQPHIIQIASDPDVARAQAMAKAVRRDQHKMKAFVRFRETRDLDGQAVFIAWFEPEHHIVGSVAPFFMRRFAGMRWSILTPRASAHWDGTALSIGPGAARASAPEGDDLEAFWRTYYASIFNPARLKVKAMTAEMPKKYWRNLPEAELIAPLIRQAGARMQEMIMAPPTIGRARAAREAAPDPVPEQSPLLDGLQELTPALNACRRCPLFADATQGVPGEGRAGAAIMFVGEQPGDQEDLAGRPFVGPAGRLFDIALERVGIPRAEAYVTNAVKHFKFEPRGKRRIHKKPAASEIDRCKWWLSNELRLVRPRLVVALGATAAGSLTGRAVGVQAERGVVHRAAAWSASPERAAWPMALAEAPDMLVTVHPSFLLRLQDEEQKRVEWRAFLRDLTAAASAAGLPARAPSAG